jgi:ActR/RegA family two-component response regulator
VESVSGVFGGMDAPTALLLCGEGSVPGALLARTVTEAGFDVVTTRRWSETVHRAVDLPVAVVVVDLALAGAVGVRLIPVLRAVAPSCEVIAISPLDPVDLASVEAGAAAVVQPSDLRPLTSALRRIAAVRARV